MVASLGMGDYDTDVYAWSLRQGALLRRLAAGEHVNDADLDWPNIAEEIETVGRSERAMVASHIRNVMEHLIKLHASPATEPRPGVRAGFALVSSSQRARCSRATSRAPSHWQLAQ